MEVFYSYDVSAGRCLLDEEESAHAVRVLRHRAGDEICVIDGEGTMYRCTLSVDSPKAAEAIINETFPFWGSHPYRLTLAVCPTKNNERYDWLVEKATEIGVDRIVPIISDRSERRVVKTDRLRKIALSATKQSLKATIPLVEEPCPAKAFINAADRNALRLIACCYDDVSERVSVKDVLGGYKGNDVAIMIGPEGDFSPEEARLALEKGFGFISLGDSRLRTETAGVVAAAAVYFKYI